MVAINFMAQFACPIIQGTKIHTLRDKNRFKVGDTLQLYTGMRHKNCRLLKAVRCLAVLPIEWRGDEDWVLDHGRWLHAAHLDLFAQNDGFPHYPALYNWLIDNKGPKWSGFLIAWASTPYLPVSSK